jgi:hypothetical protein
MILNSHYIADGFSKIEFRKIVKEKKCCHWIILDLMLLEINNSLYISNFSNLNTLNSRKIYFIDNKMVFNPQKGGLDYKVSEIIIRSIITKFKKGEKIHPCRLEEDSLGKKYACPATETQRPMEGQNSFNVGMKTSESGEDIFIKSVYNDVCPLDNLIGNDMEKFGKNDSENEDIMFRTNITRMTDPNGGMHIQPSKNSEKIVVREGFYHDNLGKWCDEKNDDKLKKYSINHVEMYKSAEIDESKLDLVKIGLYKLHQQSNNKNLPIKNFMDESDEN